MELNGSDRPKPGAYRFTDHSVLRPWLTRAWFERLFPLLPGWLAANVVTLISTGALTAVIAASFVAERIGPTAFALLQLVALQLYVAGDHLDGMQAKASGTTSPLGDFLDHHCDLWAGCVLCFGFWSLAAGAPDWQLHLMTILLVVGFAITYAERAERRALHFTAWGTLEAIAILTAFYISWSIPAARAWWMGPLGAGVQRHFLAVALGSMMAIGAIMVIARRMRGVPAPVLLLSATLAGLSAWVVMRGDLPPLWGWLLVALTGAEYVARVMRAHTIDSARQWPDPVPVVITALLWVLPVGTGGLLVAVLTVWLVVRYIVTLVRIVGAWRHHWVWVNSAASGAGRAP